MNQLCRYFTVFFLFGICISTSYGQQATSEIVIPESFSVDQVITSKSIPDGVKIKFYFDKLKWRYEVQRGTETIVTIMRKDQGIQYTLMPQLKRYMAAPMTADSDPTSSWRQKNAEWKLLGKDTIRNIACEKYNVSSQGIQSYVWVSADKKNPVRVQTADGQTTLDMENFVEGPQPEDLFTIPKDYQVLQVQVGTPEQASAPDEPVASDEPVAPPRSP